MLRQFEAQHGDAHLAQNVLHIVPAQGRRALGVAPMEPPFRTLLRKLEPAGQFNRVIPFSCHSYPLSGSHRIRYGTENPLKNGFSAEESLKGLDGGGREGVSEPFAGVLLGLVEQARGFRFMPLRGVDLQQQAQRALVGRVYL
jgi:hypothetical protein